MPAKARASRAKKPRMRVSDVKPARRTGSYFLSLTVENVRCFGPKQTLDLSDGHGRPAHWTVILGNNGVGKTTLLQSLVALEPSQRPIDYFQETPIHGPRGDDLTLLMGEEIRWLLLRQGIERGLISGGVVHTHGLSEYGDADQPDTIYFEFYRKGYASSTAYPERHLSLVCYGYGATRRLGAGALSITKGAGPSDSLFREDVPLRNAEEWLLQADYAASKSSPAQDAARERRDRIKQLLVNLLPEVTDIRFVAPGKANAAARVEIQTHYGWIGMSDLSLGYRTLIAWTVDLASRLFERYPDSPDPLAEPAVVLVDEIDLHLHPQWQRKLMSDLSERFPNTQFIVTAHSPLIVQSAPDANIVVLRREGDHVVIDNDVAAIRGWRVDQILTSDLFELESARPPQLDALLAERTQLLSKPRLTQRDQKRLKELEAEIGPLPAGETATEREALELIKEFASKLKAGKK
jgi:energy-coupling factor transporter ATP-binding protein EcfA2